MGGFNHRLILTLQTFYPWRRHIIWVTLIAFTFSCILVFLKKSYYQGKTIFYVASQDLFKPEKIFGNTQKEMYYYGEREDMARVITIGKSDEIIDFLIDSFDLWKVYKFNSKNPKDHFKLRKAVRENYKVQLTKMDAIELSVEDIDPQRAANMTNAARDQIDTLIRSILKKTQIELVASFQKSIKNKEVLMQVTLDSLVLHRQKSGIFDSREQTKILSSRVTKVTTNIEREKAELDALKNTPDLSKKLADSVKIMKARIVGLQRELNLLHSPDTSLLYSLTNFNNAKGKLEDLESRYARAYDQISYDYEKLKKYNAAIGITNSSVYVVERAKVPVHISKPQRLFIVLACTLTSFLFSLGAILVITSYGDTNWQSITGHSMLDISD